MSRQSEKVRSLRQLLADLVFITMPCCFDALSAKIIEHAGFPLTFMSGFGVSAARLGLPDTGLISYSEMVDQVRNICHVTQIPVICDADTGYGNPVNVQRTLNGYIQAGAAGLMIEDQVSPKRCGHTRGKSVVDRETAFLRIDAAIEARKKAGQYGEDIILIARTDARATDGLTEALHRAEGFMERGADIIFVEAPQSVAEMKAICKVGGCQMANMVEHGVTPILPPEALSAMGYKIAAYPLTLLSAAAFAMKKALAKLQSGSPCDELLGFSELQSLVGFLEYDATLKLFS